MDISKMAVAGSDFGDLALGDGCCHDAEDFLWRYSAVTRKPFIAALGCALLATSLLGCGGSNKLQSINLTIGGQSGTFNLVGIGGTVQLKAIGNYSNSKTKDLTNVVTYTVVPDGTDVLGNPLSAPPLTVTINPTGMMTAVDPAVCTWENLQQDGTKPPAWAL